MKKYLNYLIILLQIMVFYILPLTAGPTDSMGLIVLIILLTLVLSIIKGIISDKFIYSIIVCLLFIPTIYIYVLFCLIASILGLCIGTILRKALWKKN